MPWPEAWKMPVNSPVNPLNSADINIAVIIYVPIPITEESLENNWIIGILKI